MASDQSIEASKRPHAQTNNGIPRIDLNLRDHKLPIAINWIILFISSGILPIVLYFVLRYVAHLKLGIVLAVTSAVFGVVALFSLARRMWSLLRLRSTCRPLGASKGSLDYFQCNFLAGFAGITAIVVTGNVLQNVRIVTLGLPVLITDVSAQLLLVGLLRLKGARAPFRMSSVEKGDRIRSGVYALTEDIVAVDGGQGQVYRQQLQDRYLNSHHMRSLCLRLDILWGASGLCIGAGCISLIFALDDANIAYILGWAVPWGFAGVMTLVTFGMVSMALRKESERV